MFAERKWTILALLVAVIASLGSVWLSVGMNLLACPLCFYQRTFAFSVVGVLLLGLIAGVRPNLLSLLVLPLTLGGLGVAGFHVWLELDEQLECPLGLLGLGSAPQQSLLAFGLLFFLLCADLATAAQSEQGVKPQALGIAGILGGLFVIGAIASAPPLPPVPQKDYNRNEPIRICRPPYRP